MTADLIAEIAKRTTPAAQYVVKYAHESYLWDELAAVAWLDPSIQKLDSRRGIPDHPSWDECFRP